jgi:hypothetical protein
MPKVRHGEKRSAYVKRYMHSDYSEDKPSAQRLAIAYSEYKQQKRKKRKGKG